MTVILFNNELNTETMKDGVLTTPKPHLLLIIDLSAVSISQLKTQSIIYKALSYPSWVWPLIIVIIIEPLGNYLELRPSPQLPG